jgi:hypothetical protein
MTTEPVITEVTITPDTFDDSDLSWYKQNSFRYGRHADYSPSSQFRSAFSSRSYYYGGGDSDNKNKAIRALRTLTRNANTIVDKSTGNKTEYVRQFSSGADGDGPSAELNDEKKRVVYVSPDELLEAETTEQEDAVVDALTGFALLRVQISQSIPTDIVESVNVSGRPGTSLVKTILGYKRNDIKIENVAPAGFAAEVVRDYLASVLTKSMLTADCRRRVVTNWGGFAPYFIRHAKKFATVRETLEKAELSLETIAHRLAYNMIEDENPLELPSEINDIADKYLGEELTADKLLPACREMIAEIQALLATAETPVATGEMEKELAQLFEKAQEALNKTAKKDPEAAEVSGRRRQHGNKLARKEAAAHQVVGRASGKNRNRRQPSERPVSGNPAKAS